ncbi:hypothetical protein H2512_11110 [Pasteurella multocida]|uniref:hypothetical protein n=1 Tax=Pasteurella multocida TaxID=747 RepID=UPI0029314760|nr:hypothetical protein [Pasteurella multocida]WNY73953.1 hypothetical protein H2512_11110 [Pasteurella multocida]
MNRLQRLFTWFKSCFRKTESANRPKSYSKKAWFYRSKGKPTLAQQLYFLIGVVDG